MGTEKGSSIQVKDFKFEFARTFLSEYWAEKKEIPHETIPAYLGSMGRRVLQVLSHSPVTTLSTFVIVSSALLVFSALFLFDFNLTRLLDEVKGSHEGLLYVSSEATEAERADIDLYLREKSGVQNVVFVSQTEALESFKESLGDNAGILEGITENPLPHSFEFTIPYNVEEFNEAEIKGKFPRIEEVVLGAPWVDTVEKLRTGLQRMSLVILLLVFAVVLFIISNVVKLLLFAHRSEIEIMQLVGAPTSRVYIPYILSSALQGFLGAVFALTATYILFAYFIQPLNETLVFGLSYRTFEFFPLHYLFGISIVGVLLCSVGAWFAVRKWVR